MLIDVLRSCAVLSEEEAGQVIKKLYADYSKEKYEITSGTAKVAYQMITDAHGRWASNLRRYEAGKKK